MERRNMHIDAKSFLEDDEEFLTVAQTVELLQRQPPNARVILEGCDCLGFAREVVVHDDTSELVIIGR